MTSGNILKIRFLDHLKIIHINMVPYLEKTSKIPADFSTKEKRSFSKTHLSDLIKSCVRRYNKAYARSEISVSKIKVFGCMLGML